MTDTILLVLVLLPALIVSIVFHEVAHGYVAKLLGDPTAQERRRLSLNPLRHVDPVGTLLVPGAMALFGGPIFGWAKPVPVNQRRLNHPRRDMMVVAVAGPATNIVLAAFGAILIGLIYPGYDLLQDDLPWGLIGLVNFLFINIFLAFFNLLPIPPFDGSHIFEGLLPRVWARQYRKLRPVGLALFAAIIAISWFFPDFGIIENVVWPPVLWAFNHFVAISGAVAGLIG